MVNKGQIAEYRDRLDRTLASHDLIDDKKLETLVKDQILRSSEDTSRGCTDDVIAKRTAEVANLLEMLRSASENCNASSNTAHNTSWKLKQDTEEFRVMYREGPVGSPFHSLLVEGYIDASLDVCLCVSWETELYPRWFPETFIPTFKVAVAESLQKLRINEEISLVRVKLSWPLSSREAVLHYFAFEYLQDGLVIVLMNTIPELENFQMETHGFTNEGIPDAGNTVRIDLVGGFALQKVTENKSYFRTIANMDIKLDFVPPSLINFISRQLIGSGFRHYQKTVASVSKGDESFAKALSGRLYSRIREALFSTGETRRKPETRVIQNTTNNDEEELKSIVQDASTKEILNVTPNGHAKKSSHGHDPTGNEIEEENKHKNKSTEHQNFLHNMFKAEDKEVPCNGHVYGYQMQTILATEIEEEGIKDSENLVQSEKVNMQDLKESCDSPDMLQLDDLHKNVPISPQVERALGNLDRMLTVVRGGRLKALGWANSDPEIKRDEASCSTVENYVKWADDGGTQTGLVETMAQVPQKSIAISELRSTSSDFLAPEVTHRPTSPVPNPPTPNWSRDSPSAGGNSPVSASPMTEKVNGIHENNSTENKKTGQPKKWRICCLHLISGRVVS